MTERNASEIQIGATSHQKIAGLDEKRRCYVALEDVDSGWPRHGHPAAVGYCYAVVPSVVAVASLVDHQSAVSLLVPLRCPRGCLLQFQNQLLFEPKHLQKRTFSANESKETRDYNQ